MLASKKKNDVCYCEVCSHETATECIELRCPCCLKVDQIRLNHIVVPAEDLTEVEKERRDKVDEDKQDEKRQYLKWYGPWQP